MHKKFIITVDTEGDNLWDWRKGQAITTRNTKFLPRFQELCEEYGFIPTYLTNYEMAMDDEWVQYGKKKVGDKKCEIGMHIHAWNSPPEHELIDVYGGNPYITEYPEEIVYEKIEYLTNLLEARFEVKMSSARSGRWATDDTFFHSLVKNGYQVDCSITPDIDLSHLPGRTERHGNDYSGCPLRAYEIIPGLIELPMTTQKVRWMRVGTLKQRIKGLVFGKPVWLRVLNSSIENQIALTDRLEQKGITYLEFMIHSSELMPGGNPYHVDEQAIDKLFSNLETYFHEIASRGYKGYSLTEGAMEEYEHSRENY